MEKLEIMIKLASDRNIDQVCKSFQELLFHIRLEWLKDVTIKIMLTGLQLPVPPYRKIMFSPTFLQVLLEFKEYATEVDVDFVRKAVRAIGRCAIKLERAAERCITVLLELIKIKVNYVVQEAIIVIKDIFRRYPNT